MSISRGSSIDLAFLVDGTLMGHLWQCFKRDTEGAKGHRSYDSEIFEPVPRLGDSAADSARFGTRVTPPCADADSTVEGNYISVTTTVKQ